MHPELHINFLAVLVAVFVNVIIGFLWYGPIFGKAWRKVLHYERLESLFLERRRRSSRLGIWILFRNLYLDWILFSGFPQCGRFRRQILEIFFHQRWL